MGIVEHQRQSNEIVNDHFQEFDSTSVAPVEEMQIDQELYPEVNEFEDTNSYVIASTNIANEYINASDDNDNVSNNVAGNLDGISALISASEASTAALITASESRTSCVNYCVRRKNDCIDETNFIQM